MAIVEFTREALWSYRGMYQKSKLSNLEINAIKIHAISLESIPIEPI